MERYQPGKIEYDWTINQLAAARFIELGANEQIRLTRLGVDRCNALEHTIGLANSILLSIYYCDLYAELSETEVSK